MKRIDLFRSSRKPGEPRPKRRAPRKPAHTWKADQPWRESQRGNLLMDEFMLEAMTVALCGESWGHDGERLAAVISEEFVASRMFLRVFEPREDAPLRDPEAGHLSGRGAQLARSTFRRRDSRGKTFPFTATIRHPRWTERSPLAHGQLAPKAGMSMASPIANRIVRDWPMPVPLIVGPSPSAMTSWMHLTATSSLAVWSGHHLWLFRCVDRFPSIFDVLRGLRPDAPHRETN